jgi:type I restriction enzyme S subunit
MYGATVGRLGILGREAATNQAVCGIQPNKDIDRDFLFHCLLHKRKELVGKSVGGAQPNISQAIIRDTLVPLPPLDEQRRIVGLLDRAAEIRRRADAARAKARAIIPALFLDTFGDPATNPKGWPVVTLGDLDGMELRNGISPSKAGKVSGNVLTLSAITRGQFDPTARKDAMFAGPLAAEQTVSKSLFLICRGNGNRALVGQGAFPLMDMPGVAFPDTMIALRLPEHEVAPPYLAAVWSSEHVRAQIDAAAKTTNGTFKISQSGILRFSFPLPPRPLQISFGERVSRLETLARNLDAAAAKAEAMAAGLSAEVFDAGQRKDTADGPSAQC